MKIPDTTANVGAYYGNEENGQWQPNGVIVDSGVGGGVVGSGDAGIHRPPPYPVHIPRGHMPGYVMAGAYFPPATYPPVPAPAQDDFADYMWMENEEEFDKQVMQQLEEEALMEQCIEAMLEDEQRERQHRPANVNGHNHHYPTTSNGPGALSLEETVSRSTLNPLAAEFVPTRAPPESPQESPAAPPEDSPKAEAPLSDAEPSQEPTEEPSSPTKDTPEVSAADIQPVPEKSQEKRPKDSKKDSPKPKVEAKKPAKAEVKPKAKPQVVKSETKVQAKKKDLKVVKSDVKTDEKVEDTSTEVVKPQSPPIEDSQTPSGPKPINYAAAAKANKPKKPSTTCEKPQQPTTKTEKPKTTEKATEKKDKPPQKTEKVNVQRKNSAK